MPIVFVITTMCLENTRGTTVLLHPFFIALSFIATNNGHTHC